MVKNFASVYVFVCVLGVFICVLFLSTSVHRKGGGTYFHWGGGGAKTKKGHCNVKKGTNGVHADNYH